MRDESLARRLTDDTDWVWRDHPSRGGSAYLYCGPDLLPGGIHSYCVIVFGTPGSWHVDVLRTGSRASALRVPGSMGWPSLIEFVTLLVRELEAPTRG